MKNTSGGLHTGSDIILNWIVDTDFERKLFKYFLSVTFFFKNYVTKLIS